MNHFELLLREMNTIFFVLFSMFFLIFFFSIVYCSRHQKVQQSHIDQSHRSIHLFYSPMDKHTQYKEVMSQPRRFVWFSFSHCIWIYATLFEFFSLYHRNNFSILESSQISNHFFSLLFIYSLSKDIYITVKKQNDSNC